MATSVDFMDPLTFIPTADSLGEYLDGFVDDTLARCTRCGKCFEACPMTGYAPGLKGADSRQVVPAILDLMQHGPGSAQALAWLGVCSQSGRCKTACPEGIDAMKMVRVARISALGARGGEARLPNNEEPKFFQKINAFSELQLSEDEVKQWQR
jgi:L-lactate utilization protein LutB